MPQPLTQQDYIFIRRTLDRSQESVAHMVGTNQVTWSRWERGITKPIPIFRERIQALKRQALLIARKDTCPVCLNGHMVEVFRHGPTNSITYECDACGARGDKEVG
jgi:hypothetical protein